MSDADATQARQDVVANVDEIIEHVINANISSMPYEVYSELFDAVDGLGVEIENLQSQNAKLRELAKNLYECNGSCERCVELTGRCEYKEQLRELGIEVEDD